MNSVMKKSKLFIAAALALAVFFLSQFASELLFLTVQVPELGKKLAEPTLDLKAFSLSSRLYTESAFAWLEASISAKDEQAVKKSMSLLRRALQRNPLDYQARYYLAKAYLQFSAADGDYFELALRELKRAARIRGNNKQIALDCGRIFFSLWPLLEDGDKTFATNLLVNVMPALSWPEFSPLLEMWALYVQDTPLLMELLQRKPEFFGPAADQLVVAAIPMEQRHELLALHEVHTLDTLERDAVAAGLKVTYRSGIFFKALANFQWDRLLQTDIISKEYLDGCDKLGQQYPDLCSSIFLMCERGEAK